MAFDFPANPASGDLHDVGATTYEWQDAGYWRRIVYVGASASQQGGFDEAAAEAWLNGKLSEGELLAKIGGILTGTTSSSLAVVSDVAPVNPRDGLMWFNTTDGVMLVWYADPTSGQWVAVAGKGDKGDKGDKGIDGIDGVDGTSLSFEVVTAPPATFDPAKIYLVKA